MNSKRVVAGSVLVFSVMASAAACNNRRAEPSVSVTATLDTRAGIVSVTGTSFEQRLVLTSGTRVIDLAASTADSAALSRVGGVEVLARGWAEGNAFRVASFIVRRVGEELVVDGVLGRDGERLVLDTVGGRIMLGNPPAVLRGMVGARIWIGGPLDTGPNNYGIIIPAP